VGALKITPSMISNGVEPDTLEIRFASAMSDLLPSFLSLLSSESLTSVVELKNSDDKSLIQSQTLFYPLCTVKKSTNKTDKILTSIQLKFTSDEFKAILQKSSSDRQQAVMKKENPDIKEEISDKEILYQFKPDNLFKELRVDYKDNHNNRIYPIFCFICEK